MSSVEAWEAPKPNSGRKCALCGKAPAGKAHIKVSWFRGDDVVVACCRDCKKLPDAEDRLMAVTR
jgi:hypothetical protein